jgi:hypothetical protein
LYRELLGDVRFFELLLRVDEERAAKVQASGCQHCGGPLHAAHFERKPRGVLLGRPKPPEGFALRFDWCCGTCRRRTLPPSVRFLGRKVYVAVAHALATVLVRGADRAAVRLLRRELGASWSTLRRWRAWWQGLVGSASWHRLRGQLPVDLDEGGLPGSLLERLFGSGAERMMALLRLLADDSPGFPDTLGEWR